MIDEEDEACHLTDVAGEPYDDGYGIVGDLVFEYEMPHLVGIKDSAS